MEEKIYIYTYLIDKIRWNKIIDGELSDVDTGFRVKEGQVREW